MCVRKVLIATVLIAIAVALLVARSVAADPPVRDPNTISGITLAGTVASKISYQGRLTDAGGNPLNGNYNLVFQLWDDATAGKQVGSDIVRNSVPVSDGLFTVELDVPPLAFNGQALWLRIQVNGQWLSPRQELLPVPYALSLRPGAQIGANNSAAVLSVGNLGTGTGISASSNQGWGIGVASSESVALYATSGTIPTVLITGKQAIVAYGEHNGVIAWGGQTGGSFEGATGVQGAGGTRGVHGLTESTAEGAAGVFGESTNRLADGVRGEGAHGVHGIGYTGVFGEGDVGVSGEGIVGVSGESGNDGGAGVRGTATGLDGKGVQGTADFGTGVVGSGETGVKGTSTVGVGVRGEGTTGVEGRSQSGIGVYGHTGSGVAAVMGEGPKGMLGLSSADFGEGVHGNGTGSNTEGVLGTSINAHGVAGYSNGSNGSLAIGVYGQTTATWGLATNQHLFVGGNCTGCTVAFLARNDGAEPLKVGDVVSIAGIVPPLKGQQTPVLRVQRATAAYNGFLGVVQARAAVEEVPAYAADGMQTGTLQMPGVVPGDVAPGEYLFVVVQGLVQVRADASAGAIQVGDPVEPVGAAGLAGKRSEDAPSGSMLGRALEPLAEGTGLIWMLVLGQ